MPCKEGKHDTLCWDCDKAGGRCSWSHSFTPVEGWKAVPTKVYIGGEKKDKWIDSFDVYECPEFELMEALREQRFVMSSSERARCKGWRKFLLKIKKEVEKDDTN